MSITEKLSVPLFTEALHPVSCVAEILPSLEQLMEFTLNFS